MTQPVMTLPDGTTLREGDWAKLRNGETHGPLAMHSHWHLHRSDSGSHGYRPNGKWGCTDDYGDMNSHLDIIARATNPNTAVEQLNAKDDGPILWRDISDTQKGALLLAHHEGEAIEFHVGDGWQYIDHPSWSNTLAYRIRPEPKRETVTIVGYASGSDWSFGTGDAWPIHTVRITFDTIDGQPVADSVKLTPL